MTAVLSHPRRSYDALAAVLHGTPVWERVTATLDAIAMGVGDAANLDRPIVFALRNEKHFAVATFVKSGGEAGLVDRLHLVATPDGGFRAKADKSADSSIPFACSISPADASSRRLVCAMDDTTLTALGPALLQMKVDEQGPDYHAEMGAAVIRDALAQAKHGGGDDSMSKGEALGQEMVKDFASDLDATLFDISLAHGVDATMAFRFRGNASPFTRLLTGHPERAAPPGPAFWHLPVDTNMALFGQGAESSDLEGIRSFVFSSFEDAMKGESCPDELAYVMERFRALFLTGGPFVVGIGNDVAAANKAVASLRALAKDSDAAKARTRQALEGWILIEVDEPFSKWERPSRELALIDKRFHDCTPPEKPDAKKPKDHTTVDVVATSAAEHLPKGTLHFAARTTPTKDAPHDGPPAHTTHIFVVPDGEHTWFAIGENEGMVVSRVRASLDGAQASGTLSARPGLESLRAPVAGGGFITIEGISMLGIDDDTGEQMRAADTSLRLLQSLPAKGTAPIPISWRATKAELGARVLVPPAAIPEILGALKH